MCFLVSTVWILSGGLYRKGRLNARLFPNYWSKGSLGSLTSLKWTKLSSQGKVAHPRTPSYSRGCGGRSTWNREFNTQPRERRRHLKGAQLLCCSVYTLSETFCHCPRCCLAAGFWRPWAHSESCDHLLARWHDKTCSRVTQTVSTPIPHQLLGLRPPFLYSERFQYHISARGIITLLGHFMLSRCTDNVRNWKSPKEHFERTATWVGLQQHIWAFGGPLQLFRNLVKQ